MSAGTAGRVGTAGTVVAAAVDAELVAAAVDTELVAVAALSGCPGANEGRDPPHLGVHLEPWLELH